MKQQLFTALLTGIILIPSPTHAEERAPLGAARIENRWLEAVWQPVSGELQVRTLDGARPFFTGREVLPGAKRCSWGASRMCVPGSNSTAMASPGVWTSIYSRNRRSIALGITRARLNNHHQLGTHVQAPPVMAERVDPRAGCSRARLHRRRISTDWADRIIPRPVTGGWPWEPQCMAMRLKLRRGG